MNEEPSIQQGKTERRFMPATESFAKTRLNLFRNGVKDFQKEHPEVLGATVYGSMIKGDQARETSDVDAFLYIDAENMPDKTNLQEPEKVEEEYRSNLLNRLNVSGDEYKYYKDLRSKLLSNEILENEINSRIEYGHQYNEYRQMLYEKYGDASDEEKEKLLSQEPQTRLIDFSVAGMFHAKVGTGIEKYRRLFLNKVNKLEDKQMAEAIWNDVYSDLSLMEQRKDPNVQIQIPKNLNDAIRVYDPDLYKEINKKKDEDKISELESQINDSY